MKKIILLAVAIVSFAAVTSCSKDEETATIQGKWEFSKNGEMNDGQEVLENHVHTVGCGKDYLMITATNIMFHVFYNDGGCQENEGSSSYTRSGNMITTTSTDGYSDTAEIKTLNGSTLKIYTTESSTGTIYVSVFKRIN